MRRKISCIVIKSNPLRNEEPVSSHGNFLNIRNLSSYLYFLPAKSRPVTYTKNMELENEMNDNSFERFIDFYA